MSPRLYSCAYVFGLDFDDDGRAVAAVDIDGDGDLDLVIAGLEGLRLVENTSPPRRFARVRLRATATQALALGAVVQVRTGGVTQRDFVKLTDGFQTQVPTDLHFGLGDATRIDAVTVTWPSGATQTWKDLPADRLLALTEGKPEAEATVLPRWPEATRPRTAAAFSLDVEAERLDCATREKLAVPGRPTVLNFWSPTCAGCREELPQLVALAARLGGEVRFLGVSVETRDLDAVRKAISDAKPGYGQYLSNDALLRGFFGAGGEATLPATFIFDGAGRLRRAFFRPVTGAEVAPILASMRDPGPYAADVQTLGQMCLERGELEPAQEWFRKLVELRPADPVSHFLLGAVRDALGRPDLAADCYTAAVERDPAYADARLNLGVALVKSGRARAGVAALEAGIALKGEVADALVALAWAETEAGEPARAVAALERAVKAEPRRALLRVMKGELHERLGQYPAAIGCYEEALALDAALTGIRERLRDLQARPGAGK